MMIELAKVCLVLTMCLSPHYNPVRWIVNTILQMWTVRLVEINLVTQLVGKGLRQLSSMSMFVIFPLNCFLMGEGSTMPCPLSPVILVTSTLGLSSSLRLRVVRELG